MIGFHSLNGDKVHAVNSFFESVFHTVPSNSKEKSAFLCFGESFYGTSMSFPISVFDLKKDYSSIFFGNNIYLSSLRGNKIGFHNLILMFLKILDCHQLCLISEISGRRVHVDRYRKYF